MIIDVHRNHCRAHFDHNDLSHCPTALPDLRDHFRIMVANYWWTELYKKGEWDGSKTFVDAYGKFMIGFLPHVLDFVQEKGWSVQFKDFRENNLKFENFHIFLGEDKIREYQLEAISKAENKLGSVLPFYRGIFDAATNAGKNYIMAGIIQNTNAKKVLITYHLRDLFEQAVKFFEKHFDIGTVGAKKDREGTVTLAMYKTLSNRVKTSKNALKLIEEVDLLFVDEGHRVKGSDYFDLIMKIPSEAVYMMSGTPLKFDDDESKMRVIGLSGKTLYKIKNKELIGMGVSLEPIVHINKMRGQSGFTYKDTYHHNVVNNPELFELMYQELISSDKYCLIATLLTEQALNIQAYFAKKGLHIDILSGKSSERATILEDYRTGKTKWLITTMVIKEGLNLPKIQTLILGFGGKSAITINQLIGRLIRNNGVEEKVKVVDYWMKCQSLNRHALLRQQIYKNEGYEIILHDLT